MAERIIELRGRTGDQLSLQSLVDRTTLTKDHVMKLIKEGMISARFTDVDMDVELLHHTEMVSDIAAGQQEGPSDGTPSDEESGLVNVATVDDDWRSFEVRPPAVTEVAGDTTRDLWGDPGVRSQDARLWGQDHGLQGPTTKIYGAAKVDHGPSQQRPMNYGQPQNMFAELQSRFSLGQSEIGPSSNEHNEKNSSHQDHRGDSAWSQSSRARFSAESLDLLSIVEGCLEDQDRRQRLEVKRLEDIVTTFRQQNLRQEEELNIAASICETLLSKMAAMEGSLGHHSVSNLNQRCVTLEQGQDTLRGRLDRVSSKFIDLEQQVVQMTEELKAGRECKASDVGGLDSQPSSVGQGSYLDPVDGWTYNRQNPFMSQQSRLEGTGAAQRPWARLRQGLGGVSGPVQEDLQPRPQGPPAFRTHVPDTGLQEDPAGMRGPRQQSTPDPNGPSNSRDRTHNRVGDSTNRSNRQKCPKTRASLGRSHVSNFSSDEETSDLETQGRRNQSPTYPRGRRHRSPPMPKPPTFDGKADDWKSFIFQFRQLAVDNEWGVDEKRRRLLASLRGKAVDYLNTRPKAVVESYYSLRDALERRYNISEQPGTARRQLASFVQEEKESLEEFADKVTIKCTEAYPGVEDDVLQGLAVEHFLKGAKDRQAAYGAATHKPENLQDAIREVKEAAANLKLFGRGVVSARQVTFSDSHDDGSTKGQGKLIEVVTDLIQKIGSSQRRQSPSPNRGRGISPNRRRGPSPCFNCKEVGHFFKDCQKPLTCVRCNQEGHMSYDCPERTERSASPSSSLQNASPETRSTGNGKGTSTQA